MDILKFPLSFNADGSMVKLDQGSEGYFKQLVSFALLIEPYSLPLSPDFGTYDPAFMKTYPEMLAISASKFIPEITVTSVADNFNEGGGKIQATFIYEEK